MIVEGIGKLYSFTVRKRFGVSRGLGTGSFGFGIFGADDEFSGTWQRKKTKKGWRYSLMINCWPTNPRTVAQQANRAKFAAGFAAWQALTEDLKNDWRRRAIPYHFSGFNLFMRRYLNSH